LPIGKVNEVSRGDSNVDFCTCNFRTYPITWLLFVAPITEAKVVKASTGGLLGMAVVGFGGGGAPLGLSVLVLALAAAAGNAIT
jgi:hypothetical protein